MLAAEGSSPAASGHRHAGAAPEPRAGPMAQCVIIYVIGRRVLSTINKTTVLATGESLFPLDIAWAICIMHT